MIWGFVSIKINKVFLNFPKRKCLLLFFIVHIHERHSGDKKGKDMETF